MQQGIHAQLLLPLVAASTPLCRAGTSYTPKTMHLAGAILFRWALPTVPASLQPGTTLRTVPDLRYAGEGLWRPLSALAACTRSFSGRPCGGRGIAARGDMGFRIASSSPRLPP